MDSTQLPAGSIVVGIDGSHGSDRALTWAAEQAALEKRPLTIVHSLEPLRLAPAGMMASTGVDYGSLVEEIQTTGEELVAEAVTTAVRDHPGLQVHRVLSHADPRNALLDLGQHAAMIVVGSRGRGPVSSLVLGSVSVALAKHAVCPVVVRRPHAAPRPGRGILVGVDGQSRSLPAIEFAYRMAALRERPLTVLHTYGEPASGVALTTTADDPDLISESVLVSESLAGMREKFPDVVVEVQLARGFAERSLAAASSAYELVVVGHQTRGLLDDLVHFSVAPSVIEHAECAVAVIPSPVFVA